VKRLVVAVVMIAGCDSKTDPAIMDVQKDIETRQTSKDRREKAKEAKKDKEAKDTAKVKAREKAAVELIQFAHKDTQTTFAEMYKTQRPKDKFTPSKLVMFTKTIDSACGKKTAEEGPVYCPKDETTYLDLTFFDVLKSRYRAVGTILPAFIIAHEMGHHLQHLSGSSVKKSQIPTDEVSRNALSVRRELEADCFAGVWVHTTVARKLFEHADIEAAIRAEGLMGSDMTQKAGTDPRKFTHGTSEQRMRWFRVGIESGQLDKCDTYGPDQP
jgi:uncharacterized protein